jgi:hypothetical protein
MTAGDMTDGVGHSQNRESEGERYTHQANADIWKAGGEYSTAATTQHQPECSDKFGAQFLCQGHFSLLIFIDTNRFKPDGFLGVQINTSVLVRQSGEAIKRMQKQL